MKVLMGHESGMLNIRAICWRQTLLILIDVADLAWSPNNAHLASAGFDSNIVIWDGKSFGNYHCLC
jgi:hypothetical protein